MSYKQLVVCMVAACIFNSCGWALRSESILIDHACTDITQIPEWAILRVKTSLRIAYGHTSHGAQITEGMTGLVAFANGGGRGLSLARDIFAWNSSGAGGALTLHDYAMSGDLGYYPQWVDNTRAYLDNPQNARMNVIMWAWCRTVGAKYATGTLITEYLGPMTQLEAEYPHVTFVYMTGTVDREDNPNIKAANQIIRDYCKANNKVLYDFAHIESHNPDGVYFSSVRDNCDYYASRTGPRLGNWAKEWQDSHVVGVDWYQCSSSHSEPLNANPKAYAAWWLFARLAGWSGAAGQAGIADLDGDGHVNLSDLALLGQNWLEGQR
jgi:hypothetical protein